MDQVKAVEDIIAPTLRAGGYSLVRVRLSGSRRQTLQVMAERFDGAAMTVDDCANISGAVSPILEVEGAIGGAYDLEISSPGIDRPLVKPEDFNRYAGSEAQIETKTLLHGRRKFRGRLVVASNSAVSVDLVDTVGVLQIPFVEIIDAKLMLTEDLLRVARKRDGQ